MKSFFSNKQSSCLLGKKNLFPKQLFLSKTKCLLNCPFSKIGTGRGGYSTYYIALKRTSPLHTHTNASSFFCLLFFPTQFSNLQLRCLVSLKIKLSYLDVKSITILRTRKFHSYCPKRKNNCPPLVKKKTLFSRRGGGQLFTRIFKISIFWLQIECCTRLTSLVLEISNCSLFVH